MKKWYVVFGLFLISAIVYAQNSGFYLTTEDLGDTSQARVECKDGSNILMKDVKIENSSIVGFLPDGPNMSIQTNKIEKLQTVRGNQGFLIGGISCLCIGTVVYAIVLTKATEDALEGTTPKTNVLVALSGYPIGFVIGYLIGKTMLAWRTVYEADEYGYNREKLPIDFYAGKFEEKLFAGVGIKF